MNTGDTPSRGNDVDPTNSGHLQEMVDDPDPEDYPEEDPLILDPTQDPSLPPNLREISSLASWQVSTSKPACGIEALLSPSPSHFWQSDGPQPHLLTVHFNRWVKIVKMRVYLDYLLDESYTPTKMTFWGGTGMHDLVMFYEWTGQEPHGWVDVDLDGVGVAGKAELRAFVVQVRILENHQNGKDTHVRGMQIFSKDERAGHVKPKGTPERAVNAEEMDGDIGEFGMSEPDWMGEPEIR
ncbi:hypothetical protein ACLMJK_002395 [Lecanora helva]